MTMFMAFIAFTIYTKPNIIYVAPTGNDANDGLSRSTPLLHAYYAADTVARSGDTVWLIGGTNYCLYGGQNLIGIITNKDGVNWQCDADSWLVQSNHWDRDTTGTDPGYFGIANANYRLNYRFIDPTLNNITAIGNGPFSARHNVNCSMVLNVYSDSAGVHFEGSMTNYNVIISNSTFYCGASCIVNLSGADRYITVRDSTLTVTNFANRLSLLNKPFRVADIRAGGAGANTIYFSNVLSSYADSTFSNVVWYDQGDHTYHTNEMFSCFVYVEGQTTNALFYAVNSTISNPVLTNAKTFDLIARNVYDAGQLTNMVKLVNVTKSNGKTINYTNWTGTGQIVTADSTVAVTNRWQN